MKIKVNKAVIKKEEVAYVEAGQEVETSTPQQIAKPQLKRTLKLNANKPKTTETSAPTEEAVVEPIKEETKAKTKPNDMISNKIVDKLVSVPRSGDTGTLLEMSRAALSLTKKDKNGYASSMDGKMLFVFATFKKSNFAQLDKIPAYMDVSTWLGLCKKYSDGELFALDAQERAAAKASGRKYAKYIWQNVGGSYSTNLFVVNNKNVVPNKNEATACVFKLSPGINEKTFALSAEIWPGKPDDTGRIQIISGRGIIKKINIAISWETFEEWVEMSKIVIQAHYNKLLLEEQ